MLFRIFEKLFQFLFGSLQLRVVEDYLLNEFCQVADDEGKMMFEGFLSYFNLSGNENFAKQLYTIYAEVRFYYHCLRYS